MQAAARHGGQRAMRQVLAQRGDQRVAALAAAPRAASAVPAPRGRADELERRVLQRAGDEEVVDDAGRLQPRAGRAAGADARRRAGPGAADLVSERT